VLCISILVAAADGAFNNDSHSHSTRNMLASSYAIEPTYSSFVRQVYGGGAANTDGSLATAEVHFPIGIASLPPSSDAFAFGDIFVVSASANLVQRLRWTSPTNGQVKTVLGPYARLTVSSGMAHREGTNNIYFGLATVIQDGVRTTKVLVFDGTDETPST